MVWLIRLAVVAVALAAVEPYVCGQEAAPAPAPGTQASTGFFSGIVADMPAGKLTVSRNNLGRSESRTFIIDPETKVEGKLRAKARVTVRYRTSDQGDVAVHIIVRSAQSPSQPIQPKRG